MWKTRYASTFLRIGHGLKMDMGKLAFSFQDRNSQTMGSQNEAAQTRGCAIPSLNTGRGHLDSDHLPSDLTEKRGEDGFMAAITL